MSIRGGVPFAKQVFRYDDFLHPIRKSRPNLTVWTGAHACRLIFDKDDGGQAVCRGVEVAHEGERRVARASREVVLSAGAIGTPQLLQLSGIGDQELLRSHQIPVIYDSPGVGADPSSRGTVRIASARFEDAPRIAPDYLSTEDDRRVAADPLRLTRRIASQPAMAMHEPEEFKPGIQYQTDEQLAALAGDIGTTIFHPVGTARMGSASDRGAVVDSHLRVHGVRGLRVVDASVMPTITSGNTNSPTLMIAEKAARWILSNS